MRLFPVVHLGQLSADMGFWAEVPNAVLSCLLWPCAAFLAWGAFQPTTEVAAPRLFRAGAGLLIVAAQLALFADNLLLFFGAWEGLALGAYLAGSGHEYPRAERAYLFDRLAGVPLLLGTWLLFWGLGGSFSTAGRGFFPDYSGEHPPTVQGVMLGPTLAFAALRAQLALRDPGSGASPVADMLANKLIFHVPLRQALAFLFVSSAALGPFLRLWRLFRRPTAAARLCALCGVMVGLTLLWRLGPLLWR